MESYFFGLVLSKVVNHIFWISLFNLNKPGLLVYTSYISDAVNGWAGWALAYPEFGSSVNYSNGGGGQIMPTTLLLAPRIRKNFNLSLD